MAMLIQPGSTRRVLLRARTLIGRSPAVDVLLEATDVSREHAVVAWSPNGWEIRDFGSRNGTWVDGQRVEPGVSQPLREGATLQFGKQDGAWQLITVSPPSLAASCGDRWVEGSDGLLSLPSDEDPCVIVHHEPPHGWVAEREGTCTPIDDRATIALGDDVWQVLLPKVSAPTGHWSPANTIDRVHLSFAVSADEEYVELSVVIGDETHALPSRAHHYTLLTLARSRLEDAASGDADSEHGWVYTSDLQKMLATSSNQLYVAIHRARKELEELGVAGASSLVQRRTTTRQVRIGVASLDVRTL